MGYKYVRVWVPKEGEPQKEPPRPPRKKRTVLVKPKPRKDKLKPEVKHIRRKEAMMRYINRDDIRIINRERNRDFYYTKRGLPIPTPVQRISKKLDKRIGRLYQKKFKQMAKTF